MVPPMNTWRPLKISSEDKAWRERSCSAHSLFIPREGSLQLEMTIGLYRPALSHPAAVHGQCGSWRYIPARDAVTRSAAQSRPVTCTSLGGIGPQVCQSPSIKLSPTLLTSLKYADETTHKATNLPRCSSSSTNCLQVWRHQKKITMAIKVLQL